MKKNVSGKWDRMAARVIFARDALRGLIPDLDRAIERTGDPDGLLRRIRSVAAVQADELRLALKHPEGNCRHGARSERFQPLWGVK